MISAFVRNAVLRGLKIVRLFLTGDCQAINLKGEGKANEQKFKSVIS